MSTWKPGMKARCIKSHSCGITLVGLDYRVFGVNKCSCGAAVLDLGHTWVTGTVCPCGKNYGGQIWWQGAERFVPAEPLKEVMDRIEKEGAPVELETVEA